MSSEPSPVNDPGEAMEVIALLAGEIGPRRPTSAAERRAADGLAAWLRSGGVPAELEEFPGYASFGLPFGAILATATAPSLLLGRRRGLRGALALLAGVALAGEGSLWRTPLGDLLATASSQNVVATIEPAGRVRRTLCLMAHVDSSRSGVIFHPSLVGWVKAWISLNSVLVSSAAVAEPLLGGTRSGRLALGTARAVLAAGLGLLVEREMRGQDVPGANDNASGAAVVSTLAARAVQDPLASTRIVVVLSGCEESGTLGARAFLDTHDTRAWLFLNFDNVGGSGTLRYLRREGVISHWDADPAMVGTAKALAARRPDLRMDGEPSPAGLTYDATPVLARGGRAMTLSIQDGRIENLHRMTDTVANVDPDGVGRTLSAGAELIAAFDRGEADLGSEHAPPP